MLEVVTAVKLHFWQGIWHTNMFRSGVRVFCVMNILITREEIHYKRINLFSVQRALHWETNWQVVQIFCYFLSYTIFSNKLDVWGAISKNCSKMSTSNIRKEFHLFCLLLWFFSGSGQILLIIISAGMEFCWLVSNKVTWSTSLANTLGVPRL